MKRERKKGRRDEESHWLGGGLQDSLLVDLNPFLYALDQLIAKNASQVAHHYDGIEQRPLAAILAPRDSVPWHTGMLSKHFDTCICAPEHDPILDELSERFNTSLFIGSVPGALRDSADFVLAAESAWAQPESLIEQLDAAHGILGDGGRACFPLRCEAQGEQMNVIWTDDSHSVLNDLLGHRVLWVFQSWSCSKVQLRSIRDWPSFGVADFAKRHREFFGRSARDLCLRRLYESDFQEALLGEAHWAVLLTVQT